MLHIFIIHGSYVISVLTEINVYYGKFVYLDL